MTRLLMTSIGTLLALLAGALPGLQAQRAPSISFELSPGHSAPWDMPLTATITLEYLDFASYSSVVFHADITGHEDKTRECFGQDTERDMTIEVDESEEVFTVRLFTPCNHSPGVGGSYYYTLDLSVLQIVRGPPEQRLELATVRTAFLTTEYLTPGEAVAPPEAGALLWMDPEPRTVDIHVHGWYQFRFRGDIPAYDADHLGVYFSPNDHGLLLGVGSGSLPPERPPEESCREQEDQLSSWRRAVHQSLWVTACRTGEAVIQLRHETRPLGPLYEYTLSITSDATGNRAPEFPARVVRIGMPQDAVAGTPFGEPVTASDADGDPLTYSLAGGATEYFEIDRSTGQMTLGSAPLANIEIGATYVLRVAAMDPVNRTDTTIVRIAVTEPGTLPPDGDEDGDPPTDDPTPGPGPGGGPGPTGGGGGPSGPSPSEADFEWTVKHDIEALDAANAAATGVWSDGETLWVANNPDGAGDGVYAYDLATGERIKEREFELDEKNRAPRGVWSDRITMWISDSGQNRLFAHDLASGERLPERDLALDRRNSASRGIWSDGETMWVLDGGRRDALFAYDLASGQLLAECALDSANGDPRGLWSDGVTIWVSDHGAKRLFAYRLPLLRDEAEDSDVEDADADEKELERVRDEEFGESRELSKASNNSPRGIWSDGDVMYVADASDDKVYSYNMPDAIDARLASLSLSGVDIGEFLPGREEYEGVAGEGVTETTVEAEAMQRSTTSVVIDPPDADEEAEGHQVALEEVEAITVTVISAGGSRELVYRVRFPETGWDPARDPWPHCLRGALSEGFSLVVFEGGSVEELITCAESRDIVAFYALHEGVYVSYILGAPGFVNRAFGELFPDGLPVMAPLVAGSNGPPSGDPFGDDPDDAGQPGPACLRGEIAPGFSLVVSAGGSVEDLVACAESRHVAALYALHDGVWISYTLAAQESANRPFRELYADGLPSITPLVARSEGPPAGGADWDGSASN